MKRELSFLAAFLSALFVCSCKNNDANEDCLQITKHDVIELEGSFDDNYLESWDYILLDDDNLDGILGNSYRVQYDDGLYFLDDIRPMNYAIKVFDSTGHYLNNIGRMGRARNEFLFIDEWIIDPYRNQVLLINRNGYYSNVTIKRYDYQGNFISQTETDTLTDQYHIGKVIKCMSDGSILVENNLSFKPIYEYFYIHPDGTFSTPLGTNGYDQNWSDEDLAMLKHNIQMAGDWGGFNIREANYNVLSDTTILMPKLDSHIYSLYGTGYSCIANLSCLPQVSDYDKKHLGYEEFRDDDDISTINEYKDYLYIIYNDRTEYVFEKRTSRLLRMKRDISNLKVPDHGFYTIHGNDFISTTTSYSIKNELESIDNNESEWCYSPDVMEFFRKVKDHENNIIIVAHYKR